MWERVVRVIAVVATISFIVGCSTSETGDPVETAPPTTELCDTPPPVPGAPAATTDAAAPTGEGATAGEEATTESSVDTTADPLEVVVVGDSITEENLVQIDGVLAEGGIDDVTYAALGARRIAETYEYFGPRPSGLEAIDACRADGLTPDVWLIELGTNDVPDLAGSDDPVAEAGTLIDGVLDSIPEAPQVVWVNVLHRDLLDATRSFNRALDDRAAADPDLHVVDWYSAAVGRPDWFDDAVHPNRAGAFALATLYLQALGPLASVAP